MIPDRKLVLQTVQDGFSNSSIVAARTGLTLLRTREALFALEETGALRSEVVPAHRGSPIRRWFPAES